MICNLPKTKENQCHNPSKMSKPDPVHGSDQIAQTVVRGARLISTWHPTRVIWLAKILVGLPQFVPKNICVRHLTRLTSFGEVCVAMSSQMSRGSRNLHSRVTWVGTRAICWRTQNLRDCTLKGDTFLLTLRSSYCIISNQRVSLMNRLWSRM